MDDARERQSVFPTHCTLGGFKIIYQATARLSHSTENPDAVFEVPPGELPLSVLTHLYPSRYCQSDRLDRFAHRTFGKIPPGYQRVVEICNWIHDNVDYVSGASDALTSAYDTVSQRVGVCRDFAHLGIAVCRALGVPARYVSAYAWRLEPPDFHGVFEAFLRGPTGLGWYMFDPTRMADPTGIVRIGVGRDAAEVAFCTQFGQMESDEPEVSIVGPADAPAATIQAVRSQGGVNTSSIKGLRIANVASPSSICTERGFDMPDTGSAGMTPPRAVAPPAAGSSHAAHAMTLFVMIVATLYFGKEVLMPITLALLLAFVLAPVVNLLRRVHLGRVPSVLLGVTLGLCVILAIGSVIGSQIAQLTADIPRYATTVETKVSNLRDFTIGRLSELADKIGAKNAQSSSSSDVHGIIRAFVSDGCAPACHSGIRLVAIRTSRTLSVAGVVALCDVRDRLHRCGLCPAAERGSAGPHDPSIDRALHGPDMPPEPDPRTIAPVGITLPPAWVEKSPVVLCVSGRGPLDETASGILIQLLAKHGFTGRLVTYDEVSRERIEALDTTNYHQRRDRVRLVSRYQWQPGASALSHSAAASPFATGRRDHHWPLALGSGGGT